MIIANLLFQCTQDYIRPYVANESGETLFIKSATIWCSHPTERARNSCISFDDLELEPLEGPNSFAIAPLFEHRSDLEDLIEPSGDLVINFSITGM